MGHRRSALDDEADRRLRCGRSKGSLPVVKILRLLTLFALLIAPLGMLGRHAAMAAPHSAAMPTSPEADAAAMGHCADMPAPAAKAPAHKAPASNIDCMLACSCMPASVPEIGAGPRPSAAPIYAFVPDGEKGLAPEAEPPPPRLS